MVLRFDPEIRVVSSEYYSLVIESDRYRRDSQVDDRKEIVENRWKMMNRILLVWFFVG